MELVYRNCLLFYDRKVKGAVKDRDVWNERQQEFHLKAKFFKLFTSRLRLDMGVETFVRSYRNHYQLETLRDMHQIYPIIYAGFLSSAFYLSENLKTEISLRPEYTSLNRTMNWSPRAAVSYTWNHLLVSVVAGQYTQLPETTI